MSLAEIEQNARWIDEKLRRISSQIERLEAKLLGSRQATDKPIILVIGATGNQGKAVVHHLLKSNRWTLRGLTRKKSSEKAQSIIAKGVELWEGDLENYNLVKAAMNSA